MNCSIKTHDSQALEHAIALARMGWSVVPLVPQGKRPLVQWREFQNRPMSESEIAEQFEKNPNSNLGVVTGSVSGLLVLDCDKPDALKRMGKGVPETPVCETARGQHFYFSLPEAKIRSMTIADGLEIKAQGSLVVAPPSTHPSGARYQWLIPPACFEFGADPAPPPDWLMEMLQKPQRLENEKSLELPEIVSGLPDGARNRGSAVLIGYLLAEIPREHWGPIAWPLVKAWNRLNRPPLSERDLRRTFDCIARQETRKRRKTVNITAKILQVALANFSLRELAILAELPKSTLADFKKSVFYQRQRPTAITP